MTAFKNRTCIYVYVVVRNMKYSNCWHYKQQFFSASFLAMVLEFKTDENSVILYKMQSL